MSQPNPSTAMARVIVDELIRGGVSFAVASPGSRSAALVIALSERPEIELVVHVDERSAGFRGLGRSLASGSPSLVVTTSGSAVANLMPAVVEADRAAVSLIVATADRPQELVRRRANQTMVQPGIFGDYVREALNLPEATPSDDSAGWRKAAAAAVLASLGSAGVPGPAHLNVAFEEPTVPVPDDGRTVGSPYEAATGGRSHGRPWLDLDPEPASDPLWSVDLGPRPVLLAGRGEYDPAGLTGIARALRIPVLATALSCARDPSTVANYHHLLVDGLPDALRPSGLIVVGQPGPSHRLMALTNTSMPVVHIDRWGHFSDPHGTMTEGISADPVETLERSQIQVDKGFDEIWARFAAAVDSSLEGLVRRGGPTGPAIAKRLNDVPWEGLVVGSSLPIRDVDAHLRRSGPVWANRGLSGIDGFVSTALGVATGRQGTVALVGDLSLLHDANGFLTDTRPNLVVVVVDNNGGGLFDSLPQARHAPEFERLFIVPHDRDLRILADFHRLAYHEIDTADDVPSVTTDAIDAGGLHLVHVRVSRQDDLATHRDLDELARNALSDLNG